VLKTFITIVVVVVSVSVIISSFVPTTKWYTMEQDSKVTKVVGNKRKETKIRDRQSEDGWLKFRPWYSVYTCT